MKVFITFTEQKNFGSRRDVVSANGFGIVGNIAFNIFREKRKVIFTRLGLNFRAVAADTGSIGGDRSHEFQVIADTGEDVIAYCPDSDFAANIELAPAPCVIEKLNGFYRFQILIKNKLSGKGHDFISKFLNKITIPKDIRLAIDVDPLDIL